MEAILLDIMISIITVFMCGIIRWLFDIAISRCVIYIYMYTVASIFIYYIGNL